MEADQEKMTQRKSGERGRQRRINMLYLREQKLMIEDRENKRKEN